MGLRKRSGKGSPISARSTKPPAFPNGQTTAFDYFNNVGDQRLKQIQNSVNSVILSKFDYEYDAEGQITKWTQQADVANVATNSNEHANN